MSVLLYSDENGKNIEIRNPSIKDWEHACFCIVERNKKEFSDFIKREYLENSYLMKFINNA